MIARLALIVALAAASVGMAPPQVGFAQALTATPTLTSTPTVASTAAKTSTATLSPTPTAMPSATPTATPMPSPAATLAPAPTQTPRPGATPAQLALVTVGPIFSPTPTPSRTPTRTSTAVGLLTPSGTAAPVRTVLVVPTGLATVSLTPAGTASLTPALTTDLATSSITRSSATVTWTTSLPTTSQVEYGTLSNVMFRTVVDPSLVTAHRVVLNDLLPGTTYHFHARSATAAGAASISMESTLATAPAGSGPEVADLTVEQATATLARVSWGTSTGTVAQVEYGPTANYGRFTLLKVYAQPVQAMRLSDLQPATTYHYRVKAWDAQGALGASPDATFTTAPAGQANLLGDATVQPDPAVLQGGRAAAYQYVAAQSGLASVVRVYVDAGSASTSLRVAVYEDQHGSPGGILSQGSANGLTPGWTSVNLPPVPLLRSTRYWVAVLNPVGSGSLNLRQATSGGSSVISTQSSLAAFPPSFAGGSVGARSPLSLYVQQVPPAITVTGPAEGSLVTGQTQLTAVVDDEAPVTRVQFFVDGAAVGAPLSGAPYSVTWNSFGLNPALPHTISARATDALGRSGVSGNVNVQVDNGPTISNVAMSPGLTASSARITWTTNVPADGQVDYGPTAAYGLSTPVDAVARTQHEMQLTGLSPEAGYHYRVRSRNAAGAQTVSADQVFFTYPSDE